MRLRVWVIAHRGASAVAPESTAAALRAAVGAGADMIEVDVQLTRDGRAVLFHDERMERTTDGCGRLDRLRYREVVRLDAGTWFAPRFAGQRVLLASQALRLMPRSMRVNVELKRTAHPRVLLARLSRVLAAPAARSRVLLSSFVPSLLRPWQRRGWATALICDRDAGGSLTRAARLGCVAWHPQERLATPARIARAHAAGLRVHPWVVDDPARARQLIRCGVDGFFTNDPGRLRRALR